MEKNKLDVLEKISPDSLLSEPAILSGWEGSLNEPLVSITCQAFNHESFIEDALIGFLRQETRFPFEILIHDDASTDGTVNIIKKYEHLYPRIIKPIYQTENQYSKGNRPGQLNRNRAKGKYIATCEGDDYWSDPLKLQKQVDYLEANPKTVISGHDAFVIDQKGNLLKESKLPESHKRDYSGHELQQGKGWILTMSWVYRNIEMDFAPERAMVKNGDTFFTSILGEYGGSHYHNDIKPSAYRIHDGGVWSSVSKSERVDDTINTYFWMYRYYKRRGFNSLSSLYLTRVFKEVAVKLPIFQRVRLALVVLLGIHSLKKKLKNIVGEKGVEKLKKLKSGKLN